MDTAIKVNGEDLHTAVVRISGAHFTAAQAAGLNLGGRAPKPSYKRLCRLFAKGNAHRMARFLGYAGDAHVLDLAAAGWDYATVQAALQIDSRLTAISARLPRDGWGRLDSVRAK